MAAGGHPRGHAGRTLAAFAALVTLSLGSGAVSAADPPRDPSNRDAVLFLYSQGKELLVAGRVREACVKLEDARRLDPTAINLLLRLGDCYERLGRTASAHAQYLDAATVAAKARDGREATALERARALEPRLSRLTLAVPAESDRPGLVVLRDGVMVPREELGRAALVDPGPHELEARAPGKVAWRQRREVPEGGAAIVVTIPPLAPEPPPAAELPAGSSARRTAGIVSGAVGIAGIGIGAAFGVEAIAGNDASKRGHCDAHSVCDPQGYQLRLDAQRAGNVSTAAITAGLVALAGGATLYFTARPGRRGALGVTVLASPAPSGWRGAVGLLGAL